MNSAFSLLNLFILEIKVNNYLLSWFSLRSSLIMIYNTEGYSLS